MYFKNISELDEAMRNGELDVVEYTEERERLLNNLPEWHSETTHNDNGFNAYFTQLLEKADRTKAKAI